MKIRVHEIVLGLLIASVFWTGVFLWQSSTQSPGQQAQQSTGKENTDANDRIADYTLWLVFLTGVLSTVAVIQIFFLIRSDKSTRIAAGAAKQSADTLVTTERARLFVIIEREDIVSQIAPLRGYRKSLSDSDAMNFGMLLSVEYIFKNYGKTPAILKEVSAEIVHVGRLPDEPRYFCIERMPAERVIAAGDVTEPLKVSQTLRIPGPIMLSILDDETTIYFIGRVVYETLGLECETSFLYFYTGGAGHFRPDYRPAYNKTT